MFTPKLTKEQKQARKAMLADLKADGRDFAFAHNPGSGLSCLFVRTGRNTYKVSTSVCSPDEPKFRRKVAEFLCMDRMADGVCITLPPPEDTAQASACWFVSI